MNFSLFFTLFFSTGLCVSASEIESSDSGFSQENKTQKMINISMLPATLRLEGDALFDRMTMRLTTDVIADSNLIHELKLDSIRQQMLYDISKRSDSPILTKFLHQVPSKDSLEHHFYLHLQDENKTVEDFYFLYLFHTASLYQINHINELILPNQKRVNWREVYLRKILSLEKNGRFYGQKKRNESFTTFCVWNTLKIILNK